MAQTIISTIKNWFRTGERPTQAQFWALFDSFWHKDELIPQSKVNNLQSDLNGKADRAYIDGHINDTDTHATQFNGKVDKVYGKGLSTNDFTNNYQEKVDGAVQNIEKGVPNGVADLDEDGKIPSHQLPSYVDDVIEGTFIQSNQFNDPEGNIYSPESGKIYVDSSSNHTYRWSGSAYVQIGGSGSGSNLTLGTTSSTAHRGDHGNAAYQHSQQAGGNPHGVTKAQVGLSDVDNTLDTQKPISEPQALEFAKHTPRSSTIITDNQNADYGKVSVNCYGNNYVNDITAANIKQINPINVVLGGSVTVRIQTTNMTETEYNNLVTGSNNIKRFPFTEWENNRVMIVGLRGRSNGGVVWTVTKEVL